MWHGQPAPTHRGPARDPPRPRWPCHASGCGSAAPDGAAFPPATRPTLPCIVIGANEPRDEGGAREEARNEAAPMHRGATHGWMRLPRKEGRNAHSKAAGTPARRPRRPTLPHIVIGIWGRDDERIRRAEWRLTPAGGAGPPLPLWLSPRATAGRSVFALGYDARLGHRISSVGIRKEGSRGVHGELVHVRRHFVLAVQHLVKGDFPAGVGSHAPHA